MSNEIRVRFAPSPTGYLHVGSLRTALYNYLYARKTGGKFILRIEDTDQNRFVKDAVENLLKTLQSLNIDFDEGPQNGGEFGPYFQSERTDIYRKYVDELIAKDAAYPCFCTKEDLQKMREQQKKRGEDFHYDGRCRDLSTKEAEERIANGEKYVVRLKVPKNGECTFYDLVRDKVSIPWKMVDDQVLLKSDGFPTYHLANVVDDHLMRITHVIRGEEWLSSVPKHLFLYDAFGWKPSKMCHLPLLLNSDKSKLSKRQGDVAVEDFLKKGYLKETLINFVALLGWHAKGNKEIYDLNELIKDFSLKRLNKSGAVFDLDKLNWMNKQYLHKLDIDEIAKRAKTFFQEAGYHLEKTEHLKELVEVARQRITTLDEISAFAAPFFKGLEISENDRKILRTDNSQILLKFWLENIQSAKTIDENLINKLLKRSGKELGIKGKHLYPPLRIALYGKPHGPELPTIIDILGKEKVLQRLEKQIKEK